MAGTDNWGRWGDQDERGALNLLTPDVVLEAVRTCTTGHLYRLGLPIDAASVPPIPYRGAPQRPAGTPWRRAPRAGAHRQRRRTGRVRAPQTPLRSGDVALVRTGWIDTFLDGSGHKNFAQPGIGIGAAEYLASHDVAAVGADNTAVEAIPFDQGVFLGVHIELLVRRGVPLIENLDLREMAAGGCRTGLFVVEPLLVPGRPAARSTRS